MHHLLLRPGPVDLTLKTLADRARDGWTYLVEVGNTPTLVPKSTDAL